MHQTTSESPVLFDTAQTDGATVIMMVPVRVGLASGTAGVGPEATANREEGVAVMSIGTVVLVVLILVLLGVIPAWPHARSWGYGPSGVVGTILLIVLVLFLMGRL